MSKTAVVILNWNGIAYLKDFLPPLLSYTRIPDVELVVADNASSDGSIEFLEEKYPDLSFCLIMGEDNLKSLHKWKNHEVILERYSIYVYPRISDGTIKTRFNNHLKIHKVNAPIMELSSTFIRNSIKAGKNIRPMLPHTVWKYIDEMNFYK